MATQKQCEIALEQFADALSRLKNVVGLGVVQADDEGNRRNCAVGVYVKKKVPIAKLSAKDRAPKSLDFHQHGAQGSVPVRVIEQGAVELESTDGMRG